MERGAAVGGVGDGRPGAAVPMHYVGSAIGWLVGVAAAHGPHVIRADRSHPVQRRAGSTWNGYDAPTCAIPVFGQPRHAGSMASAAVLAHRPHVIAGDGSDGIQVVVV